ncbi:MAG TPA: alkaline phosphatase family protein [Candidatus Cybelea sp.]|jgi:phospholipase C|nr:alkaline phosphatase family protein [Candidatus Cybelea sp.]
MRCNPPGSRPLVIAALALVFSACNGNNIPAANGIASGAPGLPAFLQTPQRVSSTVEPFHRRHAASGKIKHVVIIVQENRSFNNLLYGFPGATTSKYGYDSSGNQIELKPISLKTVWDLDHSSTSFFEACNGTGSIPGTDCQNNGFNKEWVGCGHSGGPPCPNQHPQYSYVPHSETKPYFAMGKQYVVADQMYASNFDASSYISHQYIIAAQAESSVNYPWGAWGCDGGSGDMVALVGPDRQVPYGYQQACYNDTSLGQEADNAGVTWGFYTASLSGDGNIWSAYQANRYVYYGSDWKNDVITPQTQFFNDVSNGKLRQISWITPTCENSDHAGCNSNTGPAWVASLVNAIGESQYWDSTAIFVFWDDYGGWYDSQPPAYVDYDGLGMRIPMIIVSPYAKKSFVSHVHYEHGSILRFVEDQFGLGRLAASDARATSPEKDCFNFKKPPRAFQAIPSVLGKDYFMHQPPDPRWPDEE